MVKKDDYSYTYELVEGKNDTMLIAPHVYSHKRPNLTGALKQGEPWTDYIVRSVCADSGAWGLVLKETSPFDANYHKEAANPFKQTLRRVVKQAKIKRVIDIHGLSDEYQYDIAMFYPIRFRKSRDLAFSIGKALNAEHLRDLLVHVFNFPRENRETLTEFSAKTLRVPAVQIEIARYIREDDLLRESFVKLLSKEISTY